MAHATAPGQTCQQARSFRPPLRPGRHSAECASTLDSVLFSVQVHVLQCWKISYLRWLDRLVLCESRL